MARKTDEERLRELEEKMQQLKAQKQQVASRLKEKERKARTKRLIEVGAIFEKHFKITGPEEAEKVALILSKYVEVNKEKFFAMTNEELRQRGEQLGEKK
ncbi:hypothetical protein [Pseudobacillus badius]|uniref:hypothetical protein n=1 Tax=Bacillus badius TaxID=1455 RepID=UPI0007B31DD8|nr:hypothetical protein [Bacillus badius]KZR60602.1 hypothetical protein A3781_06875 [Bacillus badius]MED0668488.1 hypothetical protein [Bacillus badius]